MARQNSPDRDTKSEDTLGRRLLRARLTLGARTGDRISQEEFGAMLAVHLGRDKALTGATISRWEAGEAVPDLLTIRAIASLVGFDPGWLAYGSRSEAPTPGEQRRAEVQITRESYEQQLAAIHAAQDDLIKQATASTREWYNRLRTELRELMNVDTPEARRRCRGIIREMDGPTPLDYMARTLFMSDEEAERERERDLERERRYADEDAEESEDD